MRIGIDAHAVERDGSGNCTYMRGLLLAIARVDHENEYVIYGTRLEHPFYDELRALHRFDLIRLRPASAAIRIPLTLAARSVLDRLDVLHVQYGGPLILHGRLVSTIHDVGFAHVPESFSRFARTWMPKLIGMTARRASMILTGSEFSKHQIMDLADVPADRIRVTHIGIGSTFAPVPDSPHRQAILLRYGITVPFVLTLGRLNSRKNLERVIDAFEGLAIRELQLVIGGQPDYGTEALNRRLRSGDTGRCVRPVGFVSDIDLPAIMSAASIFVFPSLFEGFGLPPLEAMACGTPVIASNTTAVPEILGDAALLVDPLDEPLPTLDRSAD